MNLFLDNCKPAQFANNWLPGRLLALLDVTAFKDVNEYLYKGLSDKARQHYNKAVRMDYTITVDDYQYRNNHISDILEINKSKEARQGRKMDDHYNRPEKFTKPVYCEKHHFYLILCMDRTGKIVAYMEFYIVGEFSQTSRLLGHADHLKNGIMIQIFVEAFKLCKSHGVKGFCYGEWESGTEGLKFFKKSTGFKQVKV